MHFLTITKNKSQSSLASLDLPVTYNQADKFLAVGMSAPNSKDWAIVDFKVAIDLYLRPCSVTGYEDDP